MGEREGPGLQNKETLDSINTVIQLSIIGYINLCLEGANVLSVRPSQDASATCHNWPTTMEMRQPGSGGKIVPFGCGRVPIAARINILPRSCCNQ